MKKTIRLNGENYEVDILTQTAQEVCFEWQKKSYVYRLESGKIFDQQGRPHNVLAKGRQFWLQGKTYEDGTNKRAKRSSSSQAQEGNLISPMPGKILQVLVELGQEVKKDQPLIVMEAMKMEHTLKSPHDAKVEKLPFKEGDQVSGGVELIELSKKVEG